MIDFVDQLNISMDNNHRRYGGLYVSVTSQKIAFFLKQINQINVEYTHAIHIC